MIKFSINNFIKKPPTSCKRIMKKPTTIKGYIITNRKLNAKLPEQSINSYYADSMLNLDSLKGQTILDIGSGEGGFVKDLRDREVKAFSIDFNKAIPNNIGTHSKANATQMPFKPSIFDAIYSTWSLFSYPEAQEIQIKALKEMHRILKQGGKIMLSPIKLSRIKSLIEKTGLPLKVSNKGYIPLLKRNSTLFKKLALLTGKNDTNYSRYVEITKIK